MMVVMQKEIVLQKYYLPHNELKTIYLGGGTPTILSTSDLENLFNTIYRNFNVATNAEITLEANPDDLTKQKVQELKSLPITRLSLGVQSFHEDDLQFMNRTHNARQAIDSIIYAQEAGFSNLTIDLIYGFSLLTLEKWNYNLDQAVKLEIPHLSCYCLTVEEKTALYHFIKKGKVQPNNEDLSVAHFELLMEKMNMTGYEHYEISNFAKPGWYSKHNSSYWMGEPYLGIGPSAHSFNGHSRQWNISNNALYIKALNLNEVPYQKEEITVKTSFNEYVMTSLRTQWGCSLDKIKSFDSGIYTEAFLKAITKYIACGKVVESGQCYLLTRAGKLIADKIIADLFVV